MVHRVHALPARDKPGTPGGAAEFPDHGHRSDRPGGGERVDARRGHRGRRGDDPDAPRGPRIGEQVGRRRRRVRADRCGVGDPRRTAGYRDRDRRPERRTARRRVLRSDHPATRCQRSPGGLVRPHRRRPRTWGVGRGRCRPARADAGHPARGDRRRRRVRHHPTFRRANGFRRSTRRLSGRARQARASAAGPPGRGVRRRRRVTGVPAGAADPRTAHPPRQGHQQHLHRPGPAGRHGRDVCQLPRRRGPDGDRPPGACPCGGGGRRPVRRRDRGRPRRVLRHRARPRAGPRRGRAGRGQAARYQRLASRRRSRVGGLRRDDHR